MKSLILTVIALVWLGGAFPQTVSAQDITGDWQGTLKGKETRLILRISKQLDGSLQARLLAADQNPPDWGSGNLANSVSLQGTDFKFTVDGLKSQLRRQAQHRRQLDNRHTHAGRAITTRLVSRNERDRMA